MNDGSSSAHDILRLAASLQAIAKVLADLADGRRADLVMQAIRDPLSVRTAVERYDRGQQEIHALQKHLAQIIDLRDHVVSETDLYDRFKTLDEQVFPRLLVKISQRNLDLVAAQVSSRVLMMRLRAKLSEYLLQDTWDWIPTTVQIREGVAAKIAAQIKEAINETFVAAGRLFDGSIDPTLEKFIELRIDGILRDVVRRLIGAQLPGASELPQIIERSVQRCIEGLVAEGYDTYGLAVDIRSAAMKASDLIFDVARAGAILTFPERGELHNPDVHEANDSPDTTAVVAAVTFPGLQRGDRVLQRPQVITAPRPEPSAKTEENLPSASSDGSTSPA